MSLLAMTAASWGVLMALSPVLQLRQMRRRRSSEGVSLGYLAVLQIGFALWIAYAVSVGDPALIVPNSVAFVVMGATFLVAVWLRPSIRRRLRRRRPARSA